MYRLLGAILLPLTLLTPDASSGEKPLRVAILAGQGKKELISYSKHLQANFNVKCEIVEAESAKQDKVTKKHIPGPFQNLEALDRCDVILSNLYRTWAPEEQLAILKKAFQRNPVVGLRKAHHGFQNWLEADKEVFGVKYKGHYFGKNVGIQIVDRHKDHPFFKSLKPFLPGGGLYQHTDLSSDVEVLMVGAPEDKPASPQMWTRVVKDRGDQRVCYTRYDPGDLTRDAGVRDMVTTALFWAAGREVEGKKE